MTKIKSFSAFKSSSFVPQILILFFLSSNLLFAQDESQKLIENEIITQSISDEIMSPYCPGRTLSACPSDDARKLRLRILGMLNQNYTVDAVKRQLVGMFGKEILGKPSFNGFGLIAWFLPFLILLSAVFLIFLLIRINYKRKEVGVVVESDLDQIEKSLYSKLKK